ncbi:protein shank isoform X3 [Bactrocera neohumeralis]|uniref:protein shank isoform X3 n=1 Tax=Bactrocera neohumeralis TaxID=98809 RepID=UPI0021654D8E|nr:protein shank isoform X3 [Bactrocera neohumeralis]
MDSGPGPGFDDEPPPEPRDGWLLVRVHVPELNVFKCLQFPSDRLVWDVKQQVLSSLPKVAFWFKELKESFNYGLFSPPSNGKAGKFLDEERRLGDYPFNGPVGYLELKYKRRVYKMLNLDERQLKALHTRANLRRFLECIHAGHVDKIAKMCSKGLDPNFHCPESGETPLTVATGAKKPNKLLIALVNGGALLDYRTKDGTTALHKAVEKDSLEAVTTLLELGASPNYKDGRGITPLYLSIARKCDPKVTESLLHDHATLGIQDTQGWNEVHQACRHGLVHHLEHLLFYGADMDGRNASGNTPLHVCAVNNQEACARMLLFRGAQRSALNYANQTPYQVAVIAGNMDLAEIIQNFKADDVDKSLGDTSDLISDSSGVGTNSDSAACSIGHPSTTVVCMEPYSGNAPGHISLQTGDVIEVVGSTDCGLLEGYIRGSNQSGFFPVDCVQEVSLRQKNTTVIPIIGNNTNNTSCQSSYLPHASTGGSVNNVANPLRSPQLSISGNATTNAANNSVDTLSLNIIAPGHTQHSPSMSLNSNGSDSVMKAGYHNTLHLVSQFSSATAPRLKKVGLNEPRTIILHRAKRGFGFILRGAKASSPLMQLKPTDRFPALQYLDDVDPGGVADMAGLRPGDFLLAIGNEDVRAASHEKVVEMIRSAGALVSMTVISPQFPNQMQAGAQFLPSIYQLSSGPNTPQASHRQCATLPRKMSLGPGNTAGSISAGSSVVSRMPAPIPPRRDPKTTLSVGRARAKSMVAGLENGGEKDDGDVPHTKSSSVESIITPTPTHPGTPVQLRTASIKARPTSSRITAAELEELFQRQQGETMDSSNSYSTMMTTSRFQSGTDSGPATPPPNTNSPMKAPLVYGSVAEMKRKAKIKNGTMRCKPCPIPSVGESNGHDLKRFHSTPDLNTHLNGSVSTIWAAANKGHHSQDDVATLHSSLQRLNVLPPPTHPPPPPPIGQVIKVETRSTSEYESTLSLQQKLKKRAENDAVTSAAIDGIQSSFNPLTNAKIYASPQELRNVMAWKLRQSQENRQSQNDQQQQHQSPAPNTQVTSSPQAGSNPSTQAQKSSSQYAQPTTSQVMLQQPQLLEKTHYDAGQQNGNSEICTTNNNNNIGAGHAPPIPEPDYSFSESDDEDENSILVARNTKLNEKITLVDIADTSGNSQASGSSTGSTSISHSLSVDEIQRVRSNLKQSKSSPNGFLKSENPQRPVAGAPGQNQSAGITAEDQKNNNKNNDQPVNEVIGEEGDNSSSGVSSDQEVAGANVKGNTTRTTDTIKKKPNVTIIEDPKANKNEETLGSKLGKAAIIHSNIIGEDIATNSPSNISIICKTKSSLTLPSSSAAEVEIFSTPVAPTLKEKTEDTNTAEISSASKIPTLNVANTAAVFEAKATATTVTVKQMVQQQHAPAIQQQQQHISATKVKSLVIQSQQMSANKGHQSVSGRVGHVQPQLLSSQPMQQQSSILPVNIPQQHLHPNQKLLATQQHIFLQQQQQQQHHHHQQQLHQQHLQQILKAKTAAAGVTGTNTAAIVTKQQQQLHKKSQHEGKDAKYESEHEQRSEDEGDLSPSPPAKGFQRHNSLTRKQAAAIAMQRASRSAAVSLMQLPPPIESDSDHYELNSTGDSSNSNKPILNAAIPSSSGRTILSVPISAENIVLAPPPQFCDCNDIKHSPQQQLNHIQSAQQNNQQQLHYPHQQYQLQIRTHMQIQGGGSSAIENASGTVAMSGGVVNVGTMGRLRNVGTTPKTPHHRSH